jgi:hypothetical protein
MSALFPDEIADYLQNNPSFFEQYADLMAQIFVPHPHGGRAVSLVERQMLTLREKNRQLEHKLAELINYGEENDAISEKGNFVGRPDRGRNLPGGDPLLNFTCATICGAARGTTLVAQARGDRRSSGVRAVSEELQVFAETLSRPYCGSTAGFGTQSWFGEHAPHIRSQALIALRNGGGTIGLVALGSEEAQRFYADMGTLYLERLGEMVSAALARVTRSVL